MKSRGAESYNALFLLLRGPASAMPQLAVANLLIQAGIYITLCNRAQKTLLHYAIEANQVAMMQALLLSKEIVKDFLDYSIELDQHSSIDECIQRNQTALLSLLLKAAPKRWLTLAVKEQAIYAEETLLTAPYAAVTAAIAALKELVQDKTVNHYLDDCLVNRKKLEVAPSSATQAI